MSRPVRATLAAAVLVLRLDLPRRWGEWGGPRAATPLRLDALLPHRVRPELGEIVHRMLAQAPHQRPRMSCLEAFAGVARGYERSSARGRMPAAGAARRFAG